MTSAEILKVARQKMETLNAHLLDVVEIKRPKSLQYAKNLAKVVSKLSPLLGNMIEFSIVDLLNECGWKNFGGWIRQDPGFPDALFQSEKIKPNPGIEVKAWFPLATEITARFKDSETIFQNDNIDVALVAWLPSHIIWGKPKIVDILVVSGKSVAAARDLHYHKPPHYIIFEPEDTTDRTANLQQTNTNGYKLQEDKCNAYEAVNFVKTWGGNAMKYSANPEYQQKLKDLLGKFPYRLDTNYAKIDRIEHPEIKTFKAKILSTKFCGYNIAEWEKIILSNDDALLEKALIKII